MKTSLTAQQINRSVASQPGTPSQLTALQLKINNSQRMTAAAGFCSQLKAKQSSVNQPQPTIQLKTNLEVAQLAKSQRVGYFSSPYARFARLKRTNEVVGGRNIATAKVKVGGVSRYITKTSKGIHSEARIKRKVDQLIAAHGANRVDVRWLYSELKPCGSDYHNCRDRVGHWFPGVPVFHSIDYTKTRHGVSAARAKRRRARASGLLKRFNTRLQQMNNHTKAAPVNAHSFSPALRRVNSDPNLSKGYTI